MENAIRSDNTYLEIKKGVTNEVPHLEFIFTPAINADHRTSLERVIVFHFIENDIVCVSTKLWFFSEKERDEFLGSVARLALNLQG